MRDAKYRSWTHLRTNEQGLAALWGGPVWITARGLNIADQALVASYSAIIRRDYRAIDDEGNVNYRRELVLTGLPIEKVIKVDADAHLILEGGSTLVVEGQGFELASSAQDLGLEVEDHSVLRIFVVRIYQAPPELENPLEGSSPLATT